jgi:F-type H+-transporting ATPase subunit delta
MASNFSPKYLNIARPYARAAFEYAKDNKQLAEWKAFLESAQVMVTHPAMAFLLNKPEVPPKQIYDVVSDVLGKILDKEKANFLLLLAEEKRLPIIPEIAGLYQNYYEALEKCSQVRVITATKTDVGFEKQLTQALTNRLQSAVTLQCEVDETLLGGAVIYIGDRVIDGSVRGKLTRLLEFSLR